MWNMCCFESSPTWGTERSDLPAARCALVSSSSSAAAATRLWHQDLLPQEGMVYWFLFQSTGFKVTSLIQSHTADDHPSTPIFSHLQILRDEQCTTLPQRGTRSLCARPAAGITSEQPKLLQVHRGENVCSLPSAGLGSWEI